MNSIRVVMIGASGAVGGHVVTTLLHHPALAALTLLGRRGLELPADRRIAQHVVDLGDPGSYVVHCRGHTVAICTLGVGQPSVVSREEFTRVDYDMPLAFATACRDAGVEHFTLLSSVGVSAASRNHYLRSKGRLEEAITALRFPRLSLVHPSMILTPTNRYGVSQAITLAVWPVLTPVLSGPARKFRGVRVEQLGRAIALNAVREGKGTEVLEWDDFQSLTSG
jgi:uncharacterized protein YbjT (DUF2867 family)